MPSMLPSLPEAIILVFPLCTTLLTPGLAPCPGLAPGRDAGSQPSHRDGRLSGDGAGPGAPFHELLSGPELGHLVSTLGQSDSARAAPHVSCTPRGDDCPRRG
jgi:hypothetical protein